MRFPLHLYTPALNILVLFFKNTTVQAKLQPLNLAFSYSMANLKFIFLELFKNVSLLQSIAIDLFPLH